VKLKYNGAADSVGLPLPALGRGEGGGEGQTDARRVIAPHPNPLPVRTDRKNGERERTEHVAPLITSHWNAPQSGMSLRSV